MDFLSIDDARSLLMEEDTLPFFEGEQESPQTEGTKEAVEVLDAGNLSHSDIPDVARYGSLQAAEHAAFEATLDAAFGKVGELNIRQELEADFQDTYQSVKENREHVNSFNNGMVGLGVDIVEIERMQKILRRSPSFASKVFSLQEQIYCDTRSNSAAHYAVRFAAKEAVVKALGTGFSEGIGVRDIEVERAKNGRPTVKLSGAALQIAQDKGVIEISISMSYTKTDAVACAMALTQAVVRATEKRKDPKKELAHQFKETRKILDEL